MAKNKNIANLNSDFLDTLMKATVGSSVKDVFSHLLLENEKQKQKKTSDKIEKLDLRAEKDDVEEQQEEQEDADGESAPEKEDSGSEKIKAQKLPDSMEVADVTKILNIIRAGKSLKDPDVQSRFDVWFGSLTPPEKVALKGFLDGIAQIITGDVEPEDASKPSAAPYNVEMGATPKEKPRRVLKKSDSPEVDNSAAGVDAPIVVGEVSDVRSIKKLMIR
jgi:hypothetical protein